MINVPFLQNGVDRIHPKSAGSPALPRPSPKAIDCRVSPSMQKRSPSGLKTPALFAEPFQVRLPVKVEIIEEILKS